MRILCPLTNLKVDSKKELFFNSLTLYTEEPELTDLEQKAFGMIDVALIKSSPGFKAVTKIENSTSVNSKLADAVFHDTVLFLFALWFVKDNSVNSPYTFLSHQDEFQKEVSVSSSSNAQGKFADTIFSLQELNQAAGYYDSIRSLPSISPCKNNINGMCSVSLANINDIYASTNLIVRALTFLEAARYHLILPMKIAFYIAAIECLFSTAPLDVNHRISELSTLYVGGDSQKKMETYKLVAFAYDVKSYFSHGASLEKYQVPAGQLEQVSSDLDSILRKILIKALSNQAVFTSGDQVRIDFLKTLTFT